jgi:hypothetical protein
MSYPDPAYSSTTETANLENPITTPQTAYDDSSTDPNHKPTFAERHRAPTTKDVETNRWTDAAPGTLKSGPGQSATACDAVADDGTGIGTGPNSYIPGSRENLTTDANGNTYETNTSTGTRMMDSASYGTDTGMDAGAGAGYSTTTGTTGAVPRSGAGYDDTPTETVGTRYEDTATGAGVSDDGVDDGTGHKKEKKNPLKKIVEAVKNV